jgi:6-pyruvoyltetrahydropterin/6-carboxytetrahydropterin synthase
MFIIEKKLKKFSAAHRLINGYQGKCRNLHGHNYTVAVTFAKHELNKHGLLIDFSLISELFNEYIQNQLDHSVIVSTNDHSLLNFLQAEQQKHYLLDKGRNSSVEVLAEELFNQFTKIMFKNKIDTLLHQVKVFETDTAWAAFRPHYGCESLNGCGHETSKSE